MNIVEFSEGILGIDHVSANVVAKCLRRFNLNDLANDLESGKRTDIQVLRDIGEKRLTEIQLSLRNVGDKVRVKAFRKAIEDLEIGIRKQGLSIPIHPYAKEED